MIGQKFSYETKKKLSASKMGNKNPMFGNSSWNKGKSSWSKGKKFSSVHKDRISHALTGKHLSAEHRYKVRLAVINDAKKKGIKFGGSGASNYNVKSCGFIDKINELIGLNLQHARNGGEVQLYGYFVDGYDKDHNVIFEYDEPTHHHPYKVKRDSIRQQDLIGEIKPSLFLRYDEINDRLYDAETQSDIPRI
jgi:hypothetical protein